MRELCALGVILASLLFVTNILLEEIGLITTLIGAY